MAYSARFTKRYTDTQKDALLRAVCIGKETVAEAVRKAARGELGVPAFTIDRQYAYQVVKQDRESYEARNPEALALAIDRELTNLAAKALRQARAVGKQPLADHDELRRAAQTLAAVKRALGEQTKPKPPAKPSAATNNDDAEPYTPTAPDVIASLLNAAPNTAKPGTRSGARSGSLADAPSSVEPTAA